MKLPFDSCSDNSHFNCTYIQNKSYKALTCRYLQIWRGLGEHRVLYEK